MGSSALPLAVPLAIMKPINPMLRAMVRNPPLRQSELVVFQSATLDGSQQLRGREMPAHLRTTRRRRMTVLAIARRRIQKLSPYSSLLLLSVPVLLVEPLKIVAVFVAGKGHWLTGTGMIIGAYAVSLFFVERLFRAVKPKLLMLGWFAKLWTLYTAFCTKVIRTASARPSSTDQELRTESAIATDPAFID
jgi:hypothetical protein